MKKFFAALLATAMVLSMASVSFAASGNSVKGWVSKYDKLSAYTDSKDSNKTYYPITQVIGPYQYEADAKVITDYSVEYGDSVYFLLVNGQGQLVTESKEAEAIKLKAKWELGGELVESMSIVRRKVTNPAFAFDGTWDVTVTDPVPGNNPLHSGAGNRGDEIKFDDRDKTNKLHIFDGNDKIIKGWQTLVPANINYTQVSSSGVTGTGTFNPTDYGAASAGKNGYEYETIGGISRGKSYIYMLAIKIKGSTNVNDSDIIGELTINKSRDNKMDDLTLDLAMNVNWEKSYINHKELIIGANGYDEEFEADINYALKFNGDDEVEFTFADESTFTVDISGQGKVLFNFNTKTDSKIASQYPLVEFNFWNGNGAKFNRTGEMFLNADVGYNTFLYQVMEDGTLGEVKGAVYDSADEGYYFKTRVLGQYVLSDTDLSDYNFRF